MHEVGLVLLPGSPLFELSLPLEIFGQDRSELHDPWYRLQLIAPDQPSQNLEHGFVATAVEDLQAMAGMDTVIVPAPRGIPFREEVPAALRTALRAAQARGARLASLSTGAFVLAAAGLLDGRRATTHWIHAAELVRQYPQVRFVPDVLYVEDGGVFTSAGAAAGLDLCLHLVARDLGARVANAVARRLMVPAHREGGQTQSGEQAAMERRDTGLGPVLTWAEQHLSEPITVEQLATEARLSLRTLARRFEAQVGTTPLQWLIQRRVEAARELLEGTDLSLEEVAQRCGFGSAQNLRLHFSAAIGVPPGAYRRAFRTEPGQGA